MKKALSILLLFAMLLSLGAISALASGEAATAEETEPIVLESATATLDSGLTLTYPAVYGEGNGVVNGYYVATAPVLLYTAAPENTEDLISRGYIVAVTDAADLEGLKLAAETLHAEGYDTLIGCGSTLMAQLAAEGGYLYAAFIEDPVVNAEGDAEAVTAELNESFEELARYYTVDTVTESSNKHEISDEDKAAVEAVATLLT